ncbi:MAG: DUF2878 domain-containing protein [Bdellovibrionaceae bacterium]|nr:DUF2878 domain-containing protein [Pseudobdellovibrionaceae bacterium]
MRLSSKNKLVNAIGFQFVWWTAAVYTNWAILIGTLFVLLHFIFLKNTKKEFYFVLIVSLIGILIDSTLTHLNFLKFQNTFDSGLTWIPIWMMFLWVAFASTINHSLSWAFKNLFLCFFVGGLGGSLSYIGAAKMGTITLLLPFDQSLLILMIVWGFFFILLNVIRKDFN